MAGPEQLLAVFSDPAIVELIINDDGAVYVERAGIKLSRLDFKAAPADVDQFLKRLVGDPKLGPDRAYADMTAPDGSRIHVLTPPIVKGAFAVTIRKRPSARPTLDDLARDGRTLTPACADFLEYAIEQRKNILVVGGTSSGKTTMLNALCGFLGTEDRILVIEDTPELTLPQPHVVYMKTRMRDADGRADITLRDLVRNTLRMRPDRIVVGEVRGSEAMELLQSMNIGQEGVMGTLHASSCREALQRLETLVMMGDIDMPLKAVRGNIALAVDLIVFVARLNDGTRRVAQVAELTGMEGDTILMIDLFKMEARKEASGMNFVLRPTKTVPKFFDQLRQQGFDPPVDLFRD